MLLFLGGFQQDEQKPGSVESQSQPSGDNLGTWKTMKGDREEEGTRKHVDPECVVISAGGNTESRFEMLECKLLKMARTKKQEKVTAWCSSQLSKVEN